MWGCSLKHGNKSLENKMYFIKYCDMLLNNTVAQFCGKVCEIGHNSEISVKSLCYFCASPQLH